MQQHKAVLVFLMFILLMAGCRVEKPPIRVGFIGGINGRKFELVIRDDANDAKAAKTEARSLVKEKVAVIIGPFTTTMVEAARAITEPEKMLLFSPTASAIQFTGKDDYFFRLCSTTTDNAEAYAHFLAERRGLRRISMVIDKKKYTFAQSWTGAFKKRPGISVVKW
jgi:branched-chain amino acid transport system substrate-binding protein